MLPVWIGSTLGMVVSDGLAIIVGKALGAKLPERAGRLARLRILRLRPLERAWKARLGFGVWLGDWLSAVTLMLAWYLRNARRRATQAITLPARSPFLCLSRLVLIDTSLPNARI